MKFVYWFLNLLGMVYWCGNLNFICDGNLVISFVGNRVIVFDFKNNKFDMLFLVIWYNVKCVGLFLDGCLVIIVDEGGDVLLVSLVCRFVLYYFYFKGFVYSVFFFFNGRKFVVMKGNIV